MSSIQASPAGDSPEETPVTESTTSAQSLDRSQGDTRTNPLWRAILAAIAVAFVVWGGGETKVVKFAPAITDIAVPGGSYKGYSSDSRRVADIKEVALRTALFGALLGLGAGLAGACVRKSVMTAVLGATVGLLVGALIGYVPVWPVMAVYTRAEDAGPGELTRAILMHLGLWLSLGVTAGLALALGLGSPRRIPVAVLGGLIGVVAGTLAYEVLGSMIYPLAETGGPVALEWQPRLLATLLVAVGAAGGAAAVVGSSAGAKPAPLVKPDLG